MNREIEMLEECCCLCLQYFRNLLNRSGIRQEGAGFRHIRFVLPPPREDFCTIALVFLKLTVDLIPMTLFWDRLPNAKGQSVCVSIQYNLRHVTGQDVL